MGEKCFNTKGYISEFFCTADNEYCFQRAGMYWELYTKANNWYFEKEFRSFAAMCEYIRELREKNAEEEKRLV